MPQPLTPTGSSSRPQICRHGASRTGLTDDLLREASQRLQVNALVATALWIISFALEAFIVPATLGQKANVPWTVHVICGTGVLLSLGVFILARRKSLPAQLLLDVGLFYMVATAVLIARLDADHFLVMGHRTPHGLSWVCVLVLVFPIMVPNTPRRVLIASTIAAIMDPIFFYGAVRWRTGDWLPLADLVFWWPNFACAALSVVPASMLQRLTRKVERARELGSYELVERIGAGGMGEVWKARHHMLARPAAIKIIRTTALGGDTSTARATLRRFEREAQATAALSSPHSIEIYDFGIDHDGSFYYVMEYLQGFDLETLVQRFGPVPSERAIHLLVQACHSLDDAHQSGLVHRDVKPANLFTCRKGQDFDFVKVLDFGLVKTEGSMPDPNSLLTLQGSLPGTPGFMAPEQLLGETGVGPATDLYALGCVGYWLVTGKLVFEGETTMKVLMAHVQDAPVPPSQRGEVPVAPDLEAVLLACLAKKPEERPTSARDLSQRLRACRVAAWDEARTRAWWSAHAPEITTAPTAARLSLSPTVAV